MELAGAVLITATIFVWGTVSARVERADLSAPIVFTLVGALLAVVGLVDTPSESVALKPLVEITLVWVLFADAARIRVQDFRQGMGEYVRLLGVGLPLTILAGWLLAVWLFPGVGPWFALLVAAALAPTDAALGLPVRALRGRSRSGPRPSPCRVRRRLRRAGYAGGPLLHGWQNAADRNSRLDAGSVVRCH